MIKTEKILIRCDPKLKTELKALADKKGVSMSEILEKSIWKELGDSKDCAKEKPEKDAVDRTSNQDAKIVAGCIYHAQNILNILEKEKKECDLIRKEVDALWDMLH